MVIRREGKRKSMGEYYDWVNVDRKEYICPSDFGMGNKLLESSNRHNSFLCAFKELLGNEWRDSRIVFLGDSKELSPNDDNETLSLLYKQSEECGYKGFGIDTIVETYTNISSWFSAAEKEVRREIEYYLKEIEIGEKEPFIEYSVNPDNPYENFFKRHGKEYRYTVNYSKKVYISDDTKCIELIYEFDEPDNEESAEPKRIESQGIDPIPYLMRHGYDGVGDWVGDIIGVSDEIPEGFVLIKEVMIDE